MSRGIPQFTAISRNKESVEERLISQNVEIIH